MVKKLFNGCLALASREFNQELARRNARRGGDSSPWFAPEEATVAEALAKIIVPSEEGSPGIAELGPSAVVSLGERASKSLDRQQFYSRGLLAFDHWALKEWGHRFAELSVAHQTQLFGMAQKKHDSWSTGTSLTAKVRRGLRALIYAKSGIVHATRLYPVIRDDVLEIFYTSRVSWTWLDYDGPPMDKGYPSLTQRC
jgi:hypothetical protein